MELLVCVNTCPPNGMTAPFVYSTTKWFPAGGIGGLMQAIPEIYKNSSTVFFVYYLRHLTYLHGTSSTEVTYKYMVEILLLDSKFCSTNMLYSGSEWLYHYLKAETLLLVDIDIPRKFQTLYSFEIEKHSD